MIAKDGYKIIFTLLIIAIVLGTIAIIYPMDVTITIAGIGLLAVLFTTWFFRDPNRKITTDDTLVVSPADGRVVAYDELEDDFVGTAKVLSIFMSVFDVHVNRMPDDGKIVSEKYIAGKFISAYNPSASFDNERRRINIDNGPERRYSVIQIAGMLARRIVPYLTEGARAKKGEKIGMIKFGSKVDIIMPSNVVVKVKLNQKLKAGKTVIGIYK